MLSVGEHFHSPPRQRMAVVMIKSEPLGGCGVKCVCGPVALVIPPKSDSLCCNGFHLGFQCHCSGTLDVLQQGH